MRKENDLYPGKRLLSIAEMKNYTGLGENAAKVWGKKHGAIRHIGRRLFYDRVIIDQVLNEPEEEEN